MAVRRLPSNGLAKKFSRAGHWAKFFTLSSHSSCFTLVMVAELITGGEGTAWMVFGGTHKHDTGVEGSAGMDRSFNPQQGPTLHRLQDHALVRTAWAFQPGQAGVTLETGTVEKSELRRAVEGINRSSS